MPKEATKKRVKSPGHGSQNAPAARKGLAADTGSTATPVMVGSVVRDWERWFAAANWRIWEAVALSLNVEPVEARQAATENLKLARSITDREQIAGRRGAVLPLDSAEHLLDLRVICRRRKAKFGVRVLDRHQPAADRRCRVPASDFHEVFR